MALVTKNFSDIITFSRASIGTYFDSAGVLQTATSGTPRFDYNPSTLAAQGLLIEEARTNFFTNTATAAAATIGTGTVTGPDSALCRTLIPNSGAVSFPNITGPVQSFTLSLGQTVDWAMSGWVAAGPVGTITLEPHFSFAVSVGGTSFTYAELQINTSNWTVRNKIYGSGLSEASAPTITLFRPGLYRFTWVVRYTQDATARNSVSASLQARNTSGVGTYTADGVSGVQYALLQAETGSFVTSTIPTTTTALTRSADVASVNTLSPWYNATASTLYAEVLLANLPPSGTFPTYASLNDGSTNNFISVSSNGFANHRVTVRSGGAALWDANAGGSIVAGTPSKWAIAASNGSQAGCANGGAVLTNSTAGLSTGINAMRIGAQFTGATVTGAAWLRRITYYPRALSGAELQTITT